MILPNACFAELNWIGVAQGLLLLEATVGVMCTAGRLVDFCLGMSRISPAANLLALLAMTGIVIVGLTTVLGFVGFLSSTTLWWSANILFLAFVLSKPASGNVKLSFTQQIGIDRWFQSGVLLGLLRSRRGVTFSLGLLLLALVLIFGTLAYFSPSLNFDSNTYRLSRIGFWLQEGNIWGFPTNDQRMNYTGHNADLVMLWILAFSTQGYAHAALAQWFGGLLAMLAIYEISRILRLSPSWRIGAVLFFCSLPSVTTQFISTQFDLFTSGFLAASITFTFYAIRTGRLGYFALSGLALGVSLGAKATITYFVPALLGLVVGGVLHYRTPIRRLSRGILIAGFFALLMACSPFIKNYMLYNNLLGYPPHVNYFTIKGKGSYASSLGANLEAYVWQSLEPASTIPLLRPITQLAFVPLTEHLLSTAEPYPNYHREINNAKEWFYSRARLTEDSVSFGSVAVLQLLAGSVIILVGLGLSFTQRTLMRPAIFGFWGSLAFFSASFVYMPYNFRFFVQAAPLAAVISIFALAIIPRKPWQPTFLVLLLGSQLTLTWASINNAENGVAASIDRSRSTLVTWFDTQLNVIHTLPPRVKRLGVAVPPDSWCTPYFRNGSGMQIKFVTQQNLASVKNAGELMERLGVDGMIIDSTWVPDDWMVTDPTLSWKVPGANRTVFLNGPTHP